SGVTQGILADAGIGFKAKKLEVSARNPLCAGGSWGTNRSGRAPAERDGSATQAGQMRYASATDPLRLAREETRYMDQCTFGAVHKGLKGSLLPTPFPVSEAKPLWRSPIF